MALVFSVMAASIKAGSMLQVSGWISTNTGIAPISAMTSEVATKVNGVVMTSSPAFTPSAISEMSKASVPEATVMQCLACVKVSSFSSSSRTSGPMMYWPCSRTVWIRALIDSFRSAYCAFRSLNSILLVIVWCRSICQFGKWRRTCNEPLRPLLTERRIGTSIPAALRVCPASAHTRQRRD